MRPARWLNIRIVDVYDDVIIIIIIANYLLLLRPAVQLGVPLHLPSGSAAAQSPLRVLMSPVCLPVPSPAFLRHARWNLYLHSTQIATPAAGVLEGSAAKCATAATVTYRGAKAASWLSMSAGAPWPGPGMLALTALTS